jgi:alkylation response protein AidB-like acyl-CoA dehydrogenase
MPGTRKKTLDCEKLTPKQAKAITALLNSPTLAQAAAAVGLSERTLQLYMTYPHFRRALNEAESLAMADAARRLAGDAHAAAALLREVVDNRDNPPAARVQAARVLLSLAPGFREHSALEARISELERSLKNEPEESS